MAVFVLCAGVYLATHAKGDDRILYTGLALIAVMGLLAVDGYYKSSTKEHYESIIKHHDKMLNDSRKENTQTKTMISPQLKTAQYTRPAEPFKNLMDDGNQTKEKTT